ncbi:putative molibdopterin-dependent oxidoreductase YjgC [Chelatococcus caeni]|uniref:Putative molibdopterin-dependent oxidoreductase YjgC n=1 Tax=Chelatococcus caeni TaxID=1348468 RepID=A0A840C9A0_9HYPH|nr:(2Fe-2S)-binding protein [Chelatococcus caeni]MBB4018897.1 putative molibdopterin-dependent oxidoreductase YjgC [Chelatococcus caeni]
MAGGDNGASAAGEGRFVQAVPREAERVRFTIDGKSAEAQAGDSLLAAILVQRPVLRRHEFDGGERAGFCLMGACQDCWVWSEAGERLRACTTPVAAGMAIVTEPPAERFAHGRAHG